MLNGHHDQIIVVRQIDTMASHEPRGVTVIKGLSIFDCKSTLIKEKTKPFTHEENNGINIKREDKNFW